MRIDGQRVLVTGANRGMGHAFAVRLATENPALLLAGSRSPGTYSESNITPIHVDLSSVEAVEHAVQSIFDATDGYGVDVLVNNAGLLVAGLLEDQDPHAIAAMLQVNLVSVMLLTRALLPKMLKRQHGLIVNNASISGYAWFPATSTYAASKAGIVAFSESLRRELAGTGVHVMHLVTPRVETEMAQSMDSQYEGLVDTTSFSSTTPADWADKVVTAMKRGDHIVGPGGRTALAKLASRLPAGALDRISKGIFTRPRSTQ